jgi:hypothetical protein
MPNLGLEAIGLEAWHFWVIVGILLFTGKIFLPGFVLVSLGLGAFAGAIAHSISGEISSYIGGYKHLLSSDTAVSQGS